MCPHDETVETHDAVRGVEGRHALAFLANRYGPEGVHFINLQIVFLAVELLDFTAASGIVLATVLRHLSIRELAVTRKPWSGSVLSCPGANLGTMTRREAHSGYRHGDTTGVVATID